MSKKPKKWPWRFVEVIWEDSHSDSSWKDYKGATIPLAVVHSRGWLIVQDDKKITLAAGVIDKMETTDDYTIGDIVSIPRGCILSIKNFGP